MSTRAAAQHWASGVRPTGTAGHLRELLSLSNILCARVINLPLSRPNTLPPSQMRKQEAGLWERKKKTKPSLAQ